jgi:hypothetical protein
LSTRLQRWQEKSETTNVRPQTPKERPQKTKAAVETTKAHLQATKAPTETTITHNPIELIHSQSIPRRTKRPAKASLFNNSYKA